MHLEASETETFAKMCEYVFKNGQLSKKRRKKRTLVLLHPEYELVATA